MKIGFLITARLKSTRLIYKAMLELKGKPLIDHVIERAKAIKGIDVVVLCTTSNPQDEPLIKESDKMGIHCFLGEPEDVLQRLCDASMKFNFDYVLGITADNPLFSIEHAEEIIRVIKKEQPDYIKVEGLPYGAAPWGMKVKALKAICDKKTIEHTEIWGYLIERPFPYPYEPWVVTTIKVDGKYYRPSYRLTVDYQDDYDFIRYLYEYIPFGKVLPLDKVIEHLDTFNSMKHPFLD